MKREQRALCLYVAWACTGGCIEKGRNAQFSMTRVRCVAARVKGALAVVLLVDALIGVVAQDVIVVLVVLVVLVFALVAVAVAVAVALVDAVIGVAALLVLVARDAIVAAIGMVAVVVVVLAVAIALVRADARSSQSQSQSQWRDFGTWKVNKVRTE